MILVPQTWVFYGCDFHFTLIALSVAFLLARNGWIENLWVTSAACKVSGIVYILFFFLDRLIIDAVTHYACSITIIIIIIITLK